MKYNLEKDQHPGNKKNNADDVQNVMNMISTSHPFLKEIVQTSGKPPNLICYTEHQLKHFSSAVKTSVIGVDRTFNLGPCYVTTTVFQEKKCNEKAQIPTQLFLDHFIFIGMVRFILIRDFLLIWLQFWEQKLNLLC